MRLTNLIMLVLLTALGLHAQNLVLTADGKQAFYPFGNQIHVMDVGNGRVTEVIDVHAVPLGLTADQAFLVVGVPDREGYSDNTTYRYWDLGKKTFDNGRESRRTRNWNFKDVSGDHFISNDGNYATLTIRRLTDLSLIISTGEVKNLGEHWRVVKLRPGPEGGYAHLDKNGTGIELFDANKKKIRTFNAHKQMVADLCFSPDGGKMVSTGERTVVWEVSTGKKLAEFMLGGFDFNRVAISPDGTTIVLRDDTGRLVACDASGKKIWETTPLTNPSLYTAIRFSQDGAIVAHWHTGDSLMIFDARTGESLKERRAKIAMAGSSGMLRPKIALAGTFVVEKFKTMSPKGTFWAAIDTGLVLRIYDVRTGLPLQAVEVKEFGENTTGALVFSSDEKLIAAGRRVFEVESGKLVNMLSGTSYDKLDGKIGNEGYLVSSDDYNSVYIWDLARMQLCRVYEGKLIGQAPMAVLTCKDETVTHWNPVTGKKIKSFKTQSGKAVCAIEDRTVLSFPYDSKDLFIYDVKTGGLIRKVTLPDFLMELEVGQGGRVAKVTGYSTNTGKYTDYIIDIGTGSFEISREPARLFDDYKIGFPTLKSNINEFLVQGFGYKPGVYYTLTTDGLLKKWEIGKLKPVTLDRDVVALAFDNRKNSSAEMLAYAKSDEIILMNMRTDKSVNRWKVRGKVVQVVLNRDATLVAAGMEVGRNTETWEPDGDAKIWKTATGEEIQNNYTVAWFPSKHNLKFHPSQDLLAWSNRKTVTRTIKGMDFRYKEYSETVYVWDVFRNRIWEEQSEEGKGGQVPDLAFSSDGKWLRSSGNINFELAGSNITRRPYNYGEDFLRVNYKAHIFEDLALSITDNNMLALSNLKTSHFVNVYAAHGGDGYLYINDRGYYTATPGMTRDIGFVSGLKTYRFDQFDLQYNRPDLIFAELSNPTELTTAYQRAYVKRLSRIGFKSGEFEKEWSLNVPVVRIKNSGVAYQQTQRDFALVVEVVDRLYPITRLNVWVNTVPVYGVSGLAIDASSGSILEKTLDLRLSAGKNIIEVSAVNARGVESARERLDIRLDVRAEKPDLYLVAIGVSDYMQDYDLRYAAKDASDLASRLGGQSDRYGAIHQLMFLNQNATREKILSARETLLNSRVDDEVIVFVAGHGLLDENLDYFIATHDVDFEAPAKRGLAYDALEGLLDGIAARKKLLMIDACHSGEVDKEGMETENTAPAVSSRAFKAVKTKRSSLGLADSFELMKELFADVRRGTGTMVISAAAGKEYAFENSEWQNGAFTYALLEGLKTSKADLNGDKEIRISELRDYVTRKVQEITGGRQNPTSRADNLEFDFRIQ